MKTTDRINKTIKNGNLRVKQRKGYYFHPDEDFREDWDWGKSKMIASKAVSRPINKFEI